MSERKYDLYSDAFRATTYETFAAMREHDPVLQQPGLDGETPIWFLTRYEDVVAMLLDDERFVLDAALALTPEELEARETPIPPELDKLINRHVLTTDGDDHRRLRRLVSKAFTPRMVEQLRPRIQEIADELLENVEARGEADLVDAFAFPLPIIVIAELLGIPSEDRDRFRVWSNTFVSPPLGEDALERFLEHTRELLTYLTELFERRRTDPAEDLVSALVQAEEQGDSLSENELFSMVILLIVAGHETTVSLIANSVLALLRHPEELERLRNDPTLVPAAVEELLRYDSPVERTLTRWAATDVELGRRTIRRGDFVVAVLGSANRDPERFSDPDTLDLDREDVRHVGFGRGRHFCLGAPLARVEAEIALTTLLRRLPGLRLTAQEDELAYRPVPLFRSLVSLPVAWGSAADA
jgi:cytochrome P450